RAGLLLHQPALGHRFHPVADVADQRPDPDPAEGAVAEDPEHEAPTYSGTRAERFTKAPAGCRRASCARFSPASSPGRGSPPVMATTSTAGSSAIRRETSASIPSR